MRPELMAWNPELELARQIQASFLPEALPEVAGWELAGRFLPAREVSGDFYDAFSLTHNRRIGFVIADVCDKGVGAALYMALVRTLIRAFAQQHYSMTWTDALEEAPVGTAGGQGRPRLPSVGMAALRNAVTLTNSYVARNHGRTGMFATLFFGVLDPSTGALAYVNCGHVPPLIVSADGSERRLMPTGPAIGILPDLEYGIESAHLDPRDLLFACTDGITEARSPGGELYGEARLCALIRKMDCPADAVADAVLAAATDFAEGADQSDDVTLLVLRRQAAG